MKKLLFLLSFFPAVSLAGFKTDYLTVTGSATVRSGGMFITGPVIIDSSNTASGADAVTILMQDERGTDRGIFEIRSLAPGTAGLSEFRGRNGSGTIASPGATVNQAPLARFSGAGYDDVSALTQRTGYMNIIAAENFTTTGQGTSLQFGVTNIGSTAVQNGMILRYDGNLGVGSTINDTYQTGVITAFTGTSASQTLGARVIGSQNKEIFEIGSFTTAPVPTLRGYGGRGSVSFHTATQNGDKLLRLAGTGIPSNNGQTGVVAAIDMDAAQTFTSSNNGTSLRFSATPNNSTTLQQLSRWRTNLIEFNTNLGVQDFVVYGDNDNSLFYIDTTNDRVGVGTSSPGTKLEVAGIIQSTGSVILSSGGQKFYDSDNSNFFQFKASSTITSDVTYVLPDDFNFIKNQNTLQAGSTFYTSSGSVSGQLNINNQSASITPLVVRLAGSQSANAQTFLNSAGTSIMQFNSDGSLQGNNDAGGAIIVKESGGNTIFRGVFTTGWTDSVNMAFFQISPSATNKAAFTSATGNPFDRFLISAVGFQTGPASYTQFPAPTAAVEHWNDFASGTNRVALEVIGNRTQAAPLQLWYKGDVMPAKGVVVATMTVAGGLVLSSVTANGGLMIPNGTSLSFDTTGQIAMDRTDDVLVMNDSGGVARVVGHSIYQFSFSISSGPAGWPSDTFPLFQTPKDMAITLVQIDATCLSVAASTLTFQLQERAFGSMNSAGSALIGTDYSTASWTGNRFTSFNDSSIAAESHIVFTTNNAPETGSCKAFAGVVWYRKNEE